jgi:GAF domain-containing protein
MSDGGPSQQPHGIESDSSSHQIDIGALEAGQTHPAHTQLQHVERLNILREISRATLAAESSQAVALAALQHIQKLIPCLRASVTEFDFHTGQARILAVHAVEQTALGEGRQVALSNFNMLGKLFEGHSELVEPLDDYANIMPLSDALAAEGVDTIALLPLIVGGEVIGSLNLGAQEGFRYTDEHMEIAGEIADAIAIAIQHTRLLEATREQQTLAEVLRDTTALLSSTLDLDKVLEYILDHLALVVPHDSANIMLIESGVARVVGQRGYDERGLYQALEQIRYTVANTPNLHQMVQTGQGMLIEKTWSYPGWVMGDESAWIRSYVGVPIRLGDKVIGFLNLDSDKPGFFTQEHGERLQAFADQAALAIQNAQLYDAEQRRRRISEALTQALGALNSTLELDELLSLVLQQLRQVIRYDSATLQRIDGGDLVVMAGQGFPDQDKVESIRFPIEPKFPNTYVVTEKKPLAIDDVVEAYPHFHDEASTYESGHIRSWLGVPLLVKDELIGMLTLDRMRVEPYTQEDVELATAFANQAAIAINNARLLQHTRDRATRMELVERIGRRSTAILDLDELLVQAADLISSTFGYYYTNILLIEGDDLVLRAASLPAVHRQRGKLSVKVGKEGITGWVAATGETLLVPDVRVEPRYIAKTHEEIVTRSELAVPINLRGEIIGVLNIESTEVDEFTPADVQMLQTITAQLAVAIQNARLYEQIQHHATELEARVAERTLELRRAYEELEALSQVKDEFVANVSHELRTPITSIKLQQQLIEMNSEQIPRHLTIMRRETNRLELIVEGLLQLTRLDQRRVELDKSPVDLNALVDQYVTDRVAVADEQGVTLRYESLPQLPLIAADQGLLGQTLGVLLTNALNYTSPGGQVFVRTCAREEEGRRWVGFSVRDTGPGIPLEEQPQIFDRFFRGEAGYESGAPGTGLGLSIAREIVDLHHGVIQVSSKGVPGRGTLFEVWLPVEDGEGDAAS